MVELPVWLVVVAGLLAVLGLLDRFLMPTMRWVLRRRLNRAIDKLNNKLTLKIPPFKLAKRTKLIDSLLFDAAVMKAIDEEAARTGEPHEVVLARAKRYAREIVPSFSAYTYFGFAMRLARKVSTFLYRVRLGAIDEEALAKIDDDASVVFVINHRSNMDYVLVTYMVSASSALSYAVGEWARVWLLQSFIRAMGGYFVRRDSSSNKLYRQVLARYVQMATEAGVVQAVFPEGGLSRSGALLPPKLGLLSYMVSNFDMKARRDIVFVPVGINYDRVLEDRVLLRSAARLASRKPGEPKKKPRFAFNPSVFLKFIARNLWLRLRGRWYRYGYAAVSFGRPYSLRQHMRNRGVEFRALSNERRFEEIERLGMHLMGEIGAVVPALPVSLVARALLAAGQTGMSGIELKGAVMAMIHFLQTRGSHVHMPRKDLEYSVTVGVRQLILRHLVREDDGIYKVCDKEIELLTFYANSIAHLFPLSEADEAGTVAGGNDAGVVVGVERARRQQSEGDDGFVSKKKSGAMSSYSPIDAPPAAVSTSTAIAPEPRSEPLSESASTPAPASSPAK